MSTKEHSFDTSSLTIQDPRYGAWLGGIIMMIMLIVLLSILVFNGSNLFLCILSAILGFIGLWETIRHRIITIEVNRKKQKVTVHGQWLFGVSGKYTIPLLDIEKLYIRQANGLTGERSAFSRKQKQHYLVLVLTDHETIRLGTLHHTQSEAEHIAAQLNSILGLKLLTEQKENGRAP